jgi:hypothetical protein
VLGTRVGRIQVAPNNRLVLVNSAVDSTVTCNACAGVEVVHSSIQGGDEPALVIGSAPLRIVNSDLRSTDACIAAAGPLQLASVLCSAAAPLFIRAVAPVGDVENAPAAIDAALNDCARVAPCIGLGNRKGDPARPFGDRVHLQGNGGDAGGAGGAEWTTTPAAAADIDGDCRPATAPDIGPDER